MKRRWQQIGLACLLGLVLAAGTVYGLYHYGLKQYRAPGPLAAEATLVVPRGATLVAIGQQLEEAGVVADARLFRLGVRLTGKAHGLRAGEYAFPAGVSMEQAAQMLARGETVPRWLTVPEGLTSVEIFALVTAAEGLTGTLGEPPPEGSLLPETYRYAWNDERAELIGHMQEALQTTLAELWPQRAEGLPINTPEEAVILASIVEKETGVAEERPLVASVFVNRLRRGMRLQSDPTVVYGLTLGTAPLGRALIFRDLDQPSPYNTCRNAGVPPDPIAKSGRLWQFLTVVRIALPLADAVIGVALVRAGGGQSQVGHGPFADIDPDVRSRAAVVLAAVARSAPRPSLHLTVRVNEAQVGQKLELQLSQQFPARADRRRVQPARARRNRRIVGEGAGELDIDALSAAGDTENVLNVVGVGDGPVLEDHEVGDNFVDPMRLSVADRVPTRVRKIGEAEFRPRGGVQDDGRDVFRLAGEAEPRDVESGRASLACQSRATSQAIYEAPGMRPPCLPWAFMRLEKSSLPSLVAIEIFVGSGNPAIAHSQAVDIHSRPLPKGSKSDLRRVCPMSVTGSRSRRVGPCPPRPLAKSRYPAVVGGRFSSTGDLADATLSAASSTRT